MTRLMDMGLERLSKLLLEMGQLSQETVATAIEAYRMGRNLQEVNRWSSRLMELDEQVSELSLELIARFQPVASDLRYIKAGMEISYGFYRFGRYAHDIMEVLEMFGELSACDHSIVERAAETTKGMIKMSVEAFTNRDIELAQKIGPMDDVVDSFYREFVRKVIRGNDNELRCALSTTLVLRYLERIADHATYIGNSVVFIVKGEEPRMILP